MNSHTLRRRKVGEILISLLLCGILIALDQYSKALASAHLQSGPIPLWEGVFELHYTINRGAAFGIFQNQIPYFLVVTTVLLIFIGYAYWRLPMDRKYRFIKGILVLLTAGAFGNLIDRAVNGYVIDFLYFKLINFPIFNVADCYVCVSAFLFFIAFLFYYKEGDFACLIPRRWRKTDESQRS